MMCAKCQAKLVGPVKKCAAGVEPYQLKCGHMGCAYNSAQVKKAMRESEDRYPVRSTQLSRRTAELSDEQLVQLFAEIYEWKSSGVLTGDKLRTLTNEYFGNDAGMQTGVESLVLFEMARRYANQKVESRG